MRTPENVPRLSDEEVRDSERWHTHYALRKTAKDLHEYAVQTDLTFPNRSRLLQITEELLQVVPPVNDSLEQIDERRRKMDRGEIDPFGED